MLTRSFTASAVLALGSSALLLTAGPARAATPSAQDTTFFTANAQANLAEITLGNLAMGKAQDAASKQLAQVTVADHTKLQAQLTSVAQADGVTLPTEPNDMQKATAAQLMATSASAFDLAYAQAEKTGHTMAIAANTEIGTGGDTALKSYATGYVPIATMHLDMANAEVSALAGSAPTAVSAGSGGAAATAPADRTVWGLAVLGGSVLVLGSGATLARRRRSA